MNENKFQELGDALKKLYGEGLPERNLAVVCDDDDIVRRSTVRMVKNVLAQAGVGIEVKAFPSAGEGGDFLANEENRKRVALLLTDNDAPGKNAGLSLVKRLREETNGIQIPAAVMSGRVTVDKKSGARRLNPVAEGMELSGQLDCLVPKPLVSDEPSGELAGYLTEAVRSRIALMAFLDVPPRLPELVLTLAPEQDDELVAAFVRSSGEPESGEDV